MHAQQQAGFFVDCVFVIGDAGAIGCSHFAQDGIRFRHDIRDAERSADFNQLTSGNNYLAIFRQRVERKQDGGGIVVDYDRGDGGLRDTGVDVRVYTFRIEKFLEQAVDVDIALTALAGFQI